MNFLFGKNTAQASPTSESPSDTKEKLSLIDKSEVVVTKSERSGFWSNLFVSNEINKDFFETLEETLLKADLGAKISMETVASFQELLEQKKIKKVEVAVTELKNVLRKLLLPSGLSFAERRIPVICLVGVNGVGKTTTLAKLAHHYKSQDYSVVIAAADTFRAAAIPQLEEWAKHTDSQLVSKGHLADAAAVAYDAVEAALAKGGGKSICLIDTAGRLENKSHLMEQLGKLTRILSRFSDQIDLKKILVADATLGRNGMDQAKVFTEKIGLDGIILTKTDTQAKAGFLLTISQELKLPVCYLTYGENLEALAPFDPDDYLDALLSHIA